ncbi:MAG: hypothetical protein M3529_14400 [Actinomycetota bacterium]|nr:hypothetical protein [Actinomycetota bacterium]
MATVYPSALDGAPATHADVSDGLAAVQSTLGINPQGPSGTTVSGRLERELFPSAGDWGMLAVTATPLMLGSSTKSVVTGRQYFTRIRVPGLTLTSVHFGVRTAGATFSNTNSIALFDAAGVKVAETADLAAVVNTIGYKSVAWATPLAAVAGYFYVGMLWSATTMPLLSATPQDANPAIIAGLGTSTTRYAYSDGTARTAWPASYSLSALGADHGGAWFGVS